jgi:hypothetical protein
LKLLNVLEGLWITAKDILPVTVVLIFFNTFVLKSPIKNIKTVVLGIILCIFGLYMFLQGINMGLMPLGNNVGVSLPSLNSRALIIGFACILGYTSTLAEPALASLAREIEEISVGAIPNRLMVHTIALGVAVGMGLGATKILYKIPTTKIIIPMLIILTVLTYLAPDQVTGLAFDSGGVTTGPVMVPLNMALGIGLSSIIEGSDPLIDGFGFIALALLGPIIAVLILGMLVKF